MDDPIPDLNLKNCVKTYANRKVQKLNNNIEQKYVRGDPLTTKNAIKFLLEGNLRTKICRYCLNVTPELSELDQILYVGGKAAVYKVTIKDMVASFHPFKVADDPNFPNKICNKCLDRTISAYLFAQQCEQAERALRNCFEDINDKFEKLDPLERLKKRGRQKLHPNYNKLYTEHLNVIDYAEPLINIINIGSESLIEKEHLPLTELECKKCWKVLPNVESLVNHEKSHPNTMWYNCRLCGKSFAKRHHLKKHQRTHSVPETPEEEQRFNCNECNAKFDTYNKCLQHKENHKFKFAIEHLIERKMNVLCSICLDKGTSLTDLDSRICIHGPYPELSGDINLYNVLASTLPDKKFYKYQELLIPSHANIMTIAKKTLTSAPQSSFPKEIDSISLVLSTPIIISTDKIINGDYSFPFAEPEIIKYNDLNTANVDDVTMKNNNDNESTKKGDLSNVLMDTENNKILLDANREIGTTNCVENVGNDELIQSKDILTFTFSNPTLVDEDQNKEFNMEFANFEKNNPKTDFNVSDSVKENCWIFNNKLCDLSTGNKTQNKADTKSYIDTKGAKDDDTKIKSDTCKFCWVFKHLEKCDYCKEPINKLQPDRNIETNKIVIEDNAKIVQGFWQCKVCLITNDSDRETCQCCDSKEYTNDVKVHFGANKTAFHVGPVDRDDDDKLIKVNPMKCMKHVNDEQNIIHVDNNDNLTIETPCADEATDMDIEENEAEKDGMETMDFEDIENQATTIQNTPMVIETTWVPLQQKPSGLHHLLIPKLTFQMGSGEHVKGRKILKPSRRLPMNILSNYTGRKICKTCLDHAITSYIFIHRACFVKNRLNTCITLMLDNLDSIEPDNNIFIEINQNVVCPKLNDFDKIFQKDEPDGEYTIDVLEDEFREESDSDDNASKANDYDLKVDDGTTDDVIHALEKSIKDSISDNTEDNSCNVNDNTLAYNFPLTETAINGYRDKLISDICSEFLTFNKKKTPKSSVIRSNLTCPVCNKHFISIYFLKRHVLKHVNQKVVCPTCKRKFASKFHLSEHVKMAHLRQTFYVACSTCGRTFTSQSKLRNHENYHKTKSCMLCDKKFLTQKHYDTHMQRHALVFRTQDPKNYHTCSFCEKIYPTDNELSLHVNKVHLQIKPYACDMCDTAFYTEYDLRNHKMVHSIPKKEKCEFCSKILKCRKQLVVHVRKHIGAKPFCCQICSQEFYSQNKREEHMILSHGGRYCCRICHYVLTTRTALKDHTKILHSYL